MPTFKSLFISLVFSTLVLHVFPCGNEYYEHRNTIPYKKNKLDLNSLLHYEGELLPYWIHGFDHEGVTDGRYAFGEKIKNAGVPIEDEYELTWKEIQTALDKKIDYKLLSDYAWNELKVGNKEYAVKLLEILYKDYSNEYNVVANLGTAYEVTGKNEKALEFLKKAVNINPQSHFGSEWIHINILEQKIKKDPDYGMIIDLKGQNGREEWSTKKIYKNGITADSLMVQMAYQLHERIGFVPAPDPIVGQLVKDFADLVTITNSNKKASEFYKYAVSYDSSILQTVPPAITEKQKTTEKKDNPKKSDFTLPIIILAVVITGVIVYSLSKKKQTHA